MISEEQLRQLQYYRMMNVTARGFNRQIAGGDDFQRINWQWTPTQDCPEKLLDILRSPKCPALYFRPAAYLEPAWKGFWEMDRIKYDDWRWEMQLRYGFGDETSLPICIEGRQPDSSTPKILAYLTATRVA